MINSNGVETEIPIWWRPATQFAGIFFAALLAYVLGIFQQRAIDDARKDELANEKENERFHLLRHAYNEIWAHLSAITILKQGFIHELKIDARKMRHANPDNVNQLFSESPTFLKKFEEAEYDVSDALSRIEFVAVKNEHFYQAKFMVRTALKSVNDFIKERHKLIDAVPKRVERGVLLEILNYYIPTLRDYSEGIAERTDLSFTMLLCVKTQIESYAQNEFPEREFKVKTLSETVRKQLPPIDYMKTFGDKLGVDFSDLANEDQPAPAQS